MHFSCPEVTFRVTVPQSTVQLYLEVDQNNRTTLLYNLALGIWTTFVKGMIFSRLVGG